MMGSEKQIVARWESRDKTLWYNLLMDQYGYTFESYNWNGSIGNKTEAEAVDYMLAIIESEKTEGKELRRTF